MKTRLAATIGPEAALRLYAAFLGDLAARLRVAGWTPWWAFTPATARFGSVVRSRRCFPQRGRDLGARIHHALATAARLGGGPAVAIGVDAPHIAIGALSRAVAAIRRGADVVVGPARDGGYYLIAVRRPVRGLFREVPWGSRRVLAVTRRRCRALGLCLIEIGTTFDVDDATDLAPLRRAVARRPDELPRTRAALRTLARSRPRPRSG